MRMNNKQLFMYCISRKQNDDLYYTKKYNEYRKTSEKCGKEIQGAEKLFNAVKRGKETTDSKILAKYFELKMELYNNQLCFLNDKEKEIIDQMMNFSEDYNQKWHWVIGYYLYSIIKLENEGKKSIDWERDMSCWRPKGRNLNDILMYLWLIEISDLELPSILKRKIDDIEKQVCKHADNKLDKELIDIFFENSVELWEQLTQKVETYMKEREAE